MFGSWWKLSIDTAMLAFESQAVIGLRMVKLAGGGAAAQAEMQRMVGEKMLAAGEIAMLMASGGSTQSVVSGYRRKVRENRIRLSGSR